MLTAAPRSMSVTIYNGTDHFNPILYTPPAPPPIPIPESRPQRNKQPASRFGVDDGAFVGAASSFASNLTSSNTGKRKIDYDELPSGKSVGDKVLAYGWYAGERRKFHAEILDRHLPPYSQHFLPPSLPCGVSFCFGQRCNLCVRFVQRCELCVRLGKDVNFVCLCVCVF